MDNAKPILFNTDMVRAILDGRKSVTRRVVKSKNHIRNIDNYNGGYQGRYIMTNLLDGIPREFTEMLLPRYRVGDILYIRETWQLLPSGFDEMPPEMNYIYKATHELSCECTKWRPSIHMPKEAARIFLKVTDVRVERLQDISVLDAKNEGIRVRANGCIDGLAFGCYNGDECVKNECKQPIIYFKDLWNSVIKKQDIDRYGWNANPWVWAYEFERVNIDG